MIKAGIVGATGYAGEELVRILSCHPNVEIKSVVSKSFAGKAISDVYPTLMGVVDNICEELDPKRLAAECDVVFTALPHGASAELVSALYRGGVRVIDLSADFRYNNADVYKQWYGIDHCDKQLLGEAVYGLCELYRDKIASAKVVGNPGCYTTASILGCAPMAAKHIIDVNSVIVDAKSGVSGAGRKEKLDYSFCECTESMKAYSVAKHRHTSEIEQELSILAGEDMVISFTPHLIPMKRGILATVYANLTEKITTAQLVDIYKDFYRGEHFVRVYDEGKLPETNHVAGSNFVDIGCVADPRTNRAVVISCIDNLFKGAAGQAVQNMNIMFGLPESAGISNPGFYL